jgi:hypothetical protein
MRIGIGALTTVALLACAAPPTAANIGGPVPPGPPFSSGHVDPLGAAVLHCNSEEVGGTAGVVLLNKNGFHGKGTCSFP